MNELKQQTRVIFETLTQHRGRSLLEQIQRHQVATGHKTQGKLQVRQEKDTMNIIVYQECLDCSNVVDVRSDSTWSLEELQAMTNKQLVGVAHQIGARGHKQMNKSDLIESIVDKYENP